MAEVFQVVGGALAVVKLSIELSSYIDKLLSATEEKQVWLTQLENIKDMNENIAKLIMLRKQRNRLSQPADLASYLEGRIQESVEACRLWLQKMIKRLKPVARGFRQNLAGPLLDHRNINFINRQKHFLDLHGRYMSMALQLLSGVDLAAIDERTRLTDERVQRMHDFLKIVVEMYGGVRAEVRNAEADADSADDEAEAASADDTDNINSLEARSSSLIDPEQLDLPETPEEYGALLRPATKLLMEAVRSNDLEKVKFLLNMSEDAQSKFYIDAENWNCLHYAALVRSSEIVKLLLENGLRNQKAFLDMKNFQGETPLMVGAKHAGAEGPHAFDMVSLLIQAGCDVNVTNKAGQSALYFAIDRPRSSGSENIADLLIKKGADIKPVKERMEEQVRKYGLESKKVEPKPPNLTEIDVR